MWGSKDCAAPPPAFPTKTSRINFISYRGLRSTSLSTFALEKCSGEKQSIEYQPYRWSSWRTASVQQPVKSASARYAELPTCIKYVYRLQGQYGALFFRQLQGYRKHKFSGQRTRHLPTFKLTNFWARIQQIKCPMLSMLDQTSYQSDSQSKGNLTHFFGNISPNIL